MSAHILFYKYAQERFTLKDASGKTYRKNAGMDDASGWPLFARLSGAA